MSAYALQMNPVYASLLSSPPASILDTNIHTSAAGCGKFAAEGLCPEARCSEILLSQAHCCSQTCHNVQSSAPARQVSESGLLVNRGLNALLGNVPNDSISDEQTKKTRVASESGLLVDGNFQNQSSTVILGLDPRIQVKQGFLSHLDSSVRHWNDVPPISSF